MLCETGRCLLCFVLYERASSSAWGACYLRHSNALSIVWILMFISSHAASSSAREMEYHIWSICTCPGQVGQEDPHQREISLEILWRQIREGMGATVGKINLNFSFFSEVMTVSEVSQLSYHPHFQVLPSGSQQQTVKGGISRWMRNWVHPACSLPATAFQWRTPSWCANTLVIFYSWPFPSPAPAAMAPLVELGLAEIVETMCSGTCSIPCLCQSCH